MFIFIFLKGGFIMLLNNKNSKNGYTINNQYPIIALICSILCILCLLFSKTQINIYIMSVFLCASTLLSFVGIAVSFKIEDFTGKHKGLMLSIISFLFSILIYVLPFVLNKFL